MTSNGADEAVLRATEIAACIKPLLTGQGPDVQGAVLVELVALHVAGHHPQARADVLNLHVASVQQMIPVVEREIFGTYGFPGNLNGD